MAYAAAALEGRQGLPEPPHEAAHVWSMFCDLSAARGASVPISFQEIEAYGRLTGNTPSPWEVEQIRALDMMAMEIWAKKATGPKFRDRVAGSDAAGVSRVLKSVAR